MTQEYKKLKLKDLCARLPYKVLCHINGDDTNTPRELSRIEVDELDGILLDFWTDREDYLSIQVYLSEVKPYLRQMSSMTEEEAKEIAILHNIKDILSVKVTSDYIDVIFDDGVCSTETRTIWYDELISSIEIFDWLNAHYFDYRGLIEKGLALEATEGMYIMETKKRSKLKVYEKD